MLIDSFMFYNEIELIELRLNELNSVVDYFVIVEALECHGSTARKPANLHDNWQVVKPFEHKIKYMVLGTLFPPLLSRADIWPRENHHRNEIMEVVEQFASPADILMISDADEIPRASAVKDNVQRLSNEICSFSQDFFYYTVNHCFGLWNGTVAGTVGNIQSVGGPQECRNRRDGLPSIGDGGWHFSYFGGTERIRNKVANFAHAADDMCREVIARDPKEIEADVKAGRDLYHRANEQKDYRHRETNDPRLPAYFLNNVDRFPNFHE